MRVLFVALLLAGCTCEGTFTPPSPGLERMVSQPRWEAYEAESFFADGMAMRVPPEGTVVFGGEASELAPPLDGALVAHGARRYEIFCAPCHGLDGRSETPVARDMALAPPPSLHEPRLVASADVYLYEVVRNGYGLMPSYAARLDPRDRWAVVAYVRALQLAPRVPVAWLPSSRGRSR